MIADIRLRVAKLCIRALGRKCGNGELLVAMMICIAFILDEKYNYLHSEIRHQMFSDIESKPSLDIEAMSTIAKQTIDRYSTIYT